MTIFDGLKAYLRASPYPLTVQDRIWAQRGPEFPLAVAPYIVFYMMAPEPIHGHSGPSKLIQRYFQFSVFSLQASEALAISTALRGLLDGFNGTMGTVRVPAVLWTSGRAIYDPDTKLEHFSDDYWIQYYES